MNARRKWFSQLFCLLVVVVSVAGCSPVDLAAYIVARLPVLGPTPIEGDPNDYPNRVLQHLEFSPNGYTLAIGYDSYPADGIVQLWDIRQLEQSPADTVTPVVVPGHTDDIEWKVAFSPDSSRLAIGGSDGVVRVWNTGDLQAKPLELRGNRESISSLAYSPDGLMVATTCGDCGVRVWQLNSPEKPSIVLEDEPFGNGVVFTPDGKRLLLSATATSSIVMMNLAEPGSPHTEMKTPEGRRTQVAFSPDGRLAASDSVIWHTNDLEGEPIILGKGEGAFGVSWVAFSSDGLTLAEARPTEGEVRLWDIANLAEPPTIPDPVVLRHPAAYAVAFSSDGRTLASGGMFGSVRLWDYRNLDSEPLIINPSSMEQMP